jgi:hypothetical protein
MKYQETVGELCKSSPVKTKTLNLIHFIYSSSLYSLRLSTRRGKKNEICDLQKKNVSFNKRGSESYYLMRNSRRIRQGKWLYS